LNKGVKRSDQRREQYIYFSTEEIDIPQSKGVASMKGDGPLGTVAPRANHLDN